MVNISEDYTNQYGIIDKKGNYILKPQYNEIKPLGENMVAIGKIIDAEKPYRGSKYAIGDMNGNILTDFIYYNVSNYKNGLASANDDKNTFFIDKSGNIVKNLPIVKGSGTLDLEGDLIKAYVDFRISYLTRDGKVIWEQNKIIPLNNQYSILENSQGTEVSTLIFL